ncbi:MAG TPA: chemotaxis protein CheA [Pyrinomonadaceae bacterium]|nr:chemotaxis protein CheA [Pyrinomonadaceae bacterium]
MDEQLLREFLGEAEELFESLFADIGALRVRHADGRARRELVGRIFRHVHTMKGTASAAGLEATGELAHEFESALDAVRMGRVVLDIGVLDLFEETVQAIAENLSAVARGGQQTATPPALLARLRRLSATASPQTNAPTDAPESASLYAFLPAEIRQSLSEYELQRLRETAGEGALMCIVDVSFDLNNFDEQFRRLSDTLAETGEIISTLPGIEASAPERVRFRLVYATPAQSAPQVAARIAPFGATLDAHNEDAREDEPTSRAATQGERSNNNVAQSPTEDAAAFADSSSPSFADASFSSFDSAATGGSVSALTNLVRVPLEELDNLISAAHELFNDTTGALDLALAGGDARSEIETRAARIRRRFVELEAGLIELRMVPIGQTLERAARAGASVARMAGRQVEFSTSGGEVSLDKSLADAIADPLLHLLRNAVHHGIETADERIAAGKTASGRVRLEAWGEGSRVVLRVSDDGRGIDPANVTRAAVARGIVSDDAQLSEQQALRLIFRPNFSTASELSPFSGRGVGLDVVERAVERAGGELRVWSRTGAGTTFEMRLPTTLALIPSLIVHAAGERYCVYDRHVVEAGHVARSDIKESENGRVARWRAEVLPLVSLRALLGRGTADANGTNGERVQVIIAHVARREMQESGEHMPERAAVVVDGWDGRSEVLVRSLGRHATRWRGVSGATELRDGTVALVLDLPRLLEMWSGGK